MKSHWIRLVSLASAVLMMTPLAACSGGTGEGEEVSGVTDTGLVSKYYPDIPEEVRDLDGYTFTVRDYYTTRWQPEAGEQPNDTILAIVDEVERTFNCHIEFEELDVNNAFQAVQTEVLAGGKFADLVISTMWNYGRFLGAGLLGDLREVEGMDLSHPWWNQNLQETLTINNRVVGSSAPFCSHLYMTWSCYFNKTIWEELQLPDPYELVRRGEWTYDKFVQYAKRAMLDRDNSGKVDSEDDRWGLVAPDGDYCRAAYMAMGGRFFQNDENGVMRLASNNAHAYDIVEFMRKMIRDDGIHGLSSGKDFSDIIGAFVDGKSLFICCSPGEGALRDMQDDYGFLPQPKWDKEQKDYIGMVDHNAPVFCITNTNEDLDKIGYVLEALARRFLEVEELTMQSWETTIWRSDEDAEMVRKYIYNKGGYDLAPIAQNAVSQLGAPISMVFGAAFGNNADYPSTIQGAEEAVMQYLGEFLQESSRPPTDTSAS